MSGTCKFKRGKNLERGQGMEWNGLEYEMGCVYRIIFYNILIFVIA